MKKIMLIGVLIIFIIGVASAYFEFGGTYDGVKDTLQFELKEGWNVIPFFETYGYGVDTGNSATLESESIGDGILTTTCRNMTSFIYSPTAKKYAQINTKPLSNTLLNDGYNKYAYTNGGALFVYLPEDCSIIYGGQKYGQTYKVSELETALSKHTRIATGWNFITIMPWMEGKTWKDLFGGCEITKVNMWNNIYKRWEANGQQSSESATTLLNSSNPIDSATVGSIYVMKFTNECTLNSGGTSPPSLPN